MKESGIFEDYGLISSDLRDVVALCWSKVGSEDCARCCDGKYLGQPDTHLQRTTSMCLARGALPENHENGAGH